MFIFICFLLFSFFGIGLICGTIISRIFYNERYLREKFEHEKRSFIYSHLSEIYSIQDVSQRLAYDKIFQENIITASNNGIKHNKQDLDVLQERFIKLTLEMCGPNVVKDLLFIHGSYESFCLILAMWFVNKVCEDEVKILGAKRDLDPSSYSMIFNDTKVQ